MGSGRGPVRHPAEVARHLLAASQADREPPRDTRARGPFDEVGGKLRSAVSRGWYFYGMRTAIDSAGRVVIPKALRDALGLTAGQPLEITEQDGRLEIVPAATPMRLVDEGDGVAAVADADMPVLTTGMVRDTLERIRR